MDDSISFRNPWLIAGLIFLIAACVIFALEKSITAAIILFLLSFLCDFIAIYRVKKQEKDKERE